MAAPAGQPASPPPPGQRDGTTAANWPRGSHCLSWRQQQGARSWWAQWRLRHRWGRAKHGATHHPLGPYRAALAPIAALPGRPAACWRWQRADHRRSSDLAPGRRTLLVPRRNARRVRRPWATPGVPAAAMAKRIDRRWLRRRRQQGKLPVLLAPYPAWRLRLTAPEHLRGRRQGPWSRQFARAARWRSRWQAMPRRSQPPAAPLRAAKDCRRGSRRQTGRHCSHPPAGQFLSAKEHRQHSRRKAKAGWRAAALRPMKGCPRPPATIGQPRPPWRFARRRIFGGAPSVASRLGEPPRRQTPPP